LDDKYERRGNQFLTWRVSAHTAQGYSVGEYTYTIIWRQAPRDPSTNGVTRGSDTKPETGRKLGPLSKNESQAAIDQYEELTRVRPRMSHHSLHSDPDFARRTI